MLIQMSLKFVPRGPVEIKPALLRIMAWRQAIDWTNAGLVYRRKQALLGLDELNNPCCGGSEIC